MFCFSMFRRVIPALLLLTSVVGVGSTGLSNAQVTTTTITTLVTITTTASSTVSTSYITTIQELSTTIYSGTFPVPAAQGSETCHHEHLPFDAQKGQRISGKLRSNIAISFYVMWEQDYLAWANSRQCTVQRALVRAEGILAFSIDLIVPLDAKYELVFVNFSGTNAAVTGEVLGLSLGTTSYSVLLYTIFTQTFVLTTTELSTLTSTPSLAAFPLTGNEWLVVPVAGLIIPVVGYFAYRVLSQKARTRPPRTVQRPIGARLPGRRPTGYEPLDAVLLGGIPEAYSIVLLGPRSDELDLLVRRFLKAAVGEGRKAFLVSGSPTSVKSITDDKLDLAQLFLCNPRAHAIASNLPNVTALDGVENLTNLNIALTSVLNRFPPSSGVICFEILSDILLRHRSLVTRKWLSDLLLRLNARRFATLVVLDPSMHPKDEVQAVVSAFDGQIEVVERDVDGKLSRSLIVRRLRDQDYSDEEAPLERERLIGK